MNVLNKHIVYFIGIGGIGMSALARWFNAKDHLVLGYDKTPTALTDQLIAEGITVHFEEDLNAIPKDSSPENTLVVYTPAVPAAHAELDYFRVNGFTVEKRSAVLGSISNDYFTVAVAGTHGKTTTSSMIAHLLNHSGVDTTAFLGGIAVNYNSNLLIGKTKDSVAVVEADEFDRSFLQLSPNIEVITSIDPDHLDIYGNEDEMRNSFAAFIGNLKKDGKLLVSDNVDNELGLENSIVYGLNKSEVRAENIQASDKYTFDYLDADGRVDDLVLNMPGYHNTENAVAAIKVAKLLGVSNEHIKSGLSSYLGVKRRFEYLIRDKVIYIDDYAHHPEEIAAFLTSLKSMYPDRRIKVIFQPHLFSRTRDFVGEFAESLDQADEVILMDIYPARELPIEGVTSRIIYDQMQNMNKAIMSESEILHDLTQNKPDVIATLGAGNIDKLVPKIKNVLTQYSTL